MRENLWIASLWILKKRKKEDEKYKRLVEEY